MKRLGWLIGAVVVAHTVVGCREAKPTARDARGSTMTVQGSVSQELGLDNARAIAVGTNGRTFWVYLDKHGDFTLKLPIGQSYRVTIANQRVGGGQTILGHLVLPDGAGKTTWIGANETGVVNLGTLKPAAGGAGALQVKTTCATCSDGTAGAASDADDADDDKDDVDDDADHDDDNECHEDGDDDKDDADDDKDDADDDKDDDKVNACTAGSDKELEPSKKPGSKCEDKDKDKHATSADKPCEKGGAGGDAKGADDDEAEGAESSGGGGSDAANSATPPPATPPPTPPKADGATCSAASDCGSMSACVAGACVSK